MCVIFPLICNLRLFLVASETVRSRVRLLVARKHAHKARAPRTTYLIDYPAPLNHSIATAWIAPWLPATYREHQCASHFSLISWSQVRLDDTGVRLDIVPSHTYKHCALCKQPQERLSRVFKPLYRHRTDRTMDPRNL